MHSSRFLVFSSVALTACALAACGGGGGGGSTPPPVATPSPILVPGKVTTFTGTDVTTHVYASPTGTQSNYTAGYTYTQTTTVNTAASGSSAPFDVNIATTYATTQAPSAGTQRQTQTTDDFENQTVNGAKITVSLASAKTNDVGVDVTGNAGGGGPFAVTSNTTTAYTTARTLGVYPLTASTIPEPLARTVAETTTDANAGGTLPVDTFDTSVAQTYASDGSYTRTEQISNGEQDVFTENPNGSATENETGPLFTLQNTIGVPAQGTTGFTIPVTQTKQNATLGATPAPTATTMAYAAADWYPGAALPAQPLSTDVLTVKGPATTLPSGCSGAITEPNVVEIDEATATLNVDGSFSNETQQRFDSNGTNVCLLRTTTTQSFALTTGLASQTTTETVTQVLTGLTLPAATVRKTSPTT